MNEKLKISSHIAIGFMLFALFFGAGNLIFPAQLGQDAGTNSWQAIAGFLTTGVTLPLIGILAIGFSGSNNLQELASRVHPIYGLIFTALLYLSIGPFFAAPRTATVAYEVGITPFIGNSESHLGLFVFSVVFFIIAFLFSLYPAKLVDNIGKILAPLLVVLLIILLVVAYFNPMGAFQAPTEAYESTPYITGFLEGYHTMDALASLVFGIIIISIIKVNGITSRKRIFIETSKSGVVATMLLGFIYVGIALLGAASVETIGLQETGGAVLSKAAFHYFGMLGNVMLAAVIILACLTTAIGLIIANAEYFHTLIPRITYGKFVGMFSLLTFGIANFGLTNIITYSVPVLVILYPLAIALMMLSFLSPLFYHKQFVYVATITVTIFISIFDGLKELYQSLGYTDIAWMKPVIDLYEKFLPLYEEGLGWIVPTVIVLVGSIILTQIMKIAER